jgi:hypothetical protein
VSGLDDDKYRILCVYVVLTTCTCLLFLFIFCFLFFVVVFVILYLKRRSVHANSAGKYVAGISVGVSFGINPFCLFS